LRPVIVGFRVPAVTGRIAPLRIVRDHYPEARGIISGVRRIMSATLSCAATAVLAAGCSGVGPAEPGGRELPFTKEQAAAYAHAVNLAASDVPGLREASGNTPRETHAGPFGAAAGRCEAGPVRAGEVLGILSPRFVRSNAGHNANEGLPTLEVVRSGVYFFGTEALADQYLAAGDSAPFAACVKRVSAHEAKTIPREGSREALFSDVRLSPLAWPLPGVRGYGLRMTARSPLGAPTSGPSNLYQDFLSFVRGNALVTLAATGSEHPVPTAAERELLERISTRAQAHSL
jgi:hypothetical protein